MKVFDLPSGFSTIISNEESQLVDLMTKNQGSMARSELDERQQVVAANLVKKDVLTRTRIEGKIYYTVANANHIWRI